MGTLPQIEEKTVVCRSLTEPSVNYYLDACTATCVCLCVWVFVLVMNKQAYANCKDCAAMLITCCVDCA